MGTSSSSDIKRVKKAYTTPHREGYVSSYRVIDYIDNGGSLRIPFEKDGTGRYHYFHKNICIICRVPETPYTRSTQCVHAHCSHKFDTDEKGPLVCQQCQAPYRSLAGYKICSKVTKVTKPYTIPHREGYVGSYKISEYTEIPSTYHPLRDCTVHIPPEKDGTGYLHELDRPVNNPVARCTKCAKGLEYSSRVCGYLLGVQCLPTHNSHDMNAWRCLRCDAKPLTVGALYACPVPPLVVPVNGEKVPSQSIPLEILNGPPVPPEEDSSGPIVYSDSMATYIW